MDYMNILYAVLVLGIVGAVLGLLLAIASRVFHVEADERQELISEVLPGANCGGCGFAGCAAFAGAVVSGEAPVGGCSVGGTPVAEKVAEIMGVTAEEQQRRVALVACSGTDVNTNKKFSYQGLEDCVAAMKVQEGPTSCVYACLGMGNCVNACLFDAIHIGEGGIAVVDREKCTGCMACVKTCPRGIIRDVPYDSHVDVPCHSKDKGPQTRKDCAVGCIACKLCEKACEFDAIHVEENLARIDFEKCTQCGACVEKCPQKIIRLME